MEKKKEKKIRRKKKKGEVRLFRRDLFSETQNYFLCDRTKRKRTKRSAQAILSGIYRKFHLLKQCGVTDSCFLARTHFPVLKLLERTFLLTPQVVESCTRPDSARGPWAGPGQRFTGWHYFIPSRAGPGWAGQTKISARARL